MNRKYFLNFLKYMALVLFAIITLFPFYWMIASSLKTSFEVIQIPPSLIPKSPKFENTIIVTALSIIFTVIIAILSAFAFANLEFKGRDLIFAIFLASMMIPGEVLIVTNFKTISKLGWIDTYRALKKKQSSNKREIK